MLSSRNKNKRLRVTFEEHDHEPSDAEFYHEFSKYNESSLWICLMFIMTCFVQFCLEIDDTLLDVASYREESCIHEVLHVLPWKRNETTAIFYPALRGPCMMYDYNLTELRRMTYKVAEKVLAKRKKPPIIYCSVPLSSNNFSWETSFMGTCRGALYRTQLRASKLIGVSIGSFTLGTLSDLYGRKLSIYISVGLYYFGTILGQFVHDFGLANFLVVVKGMGKAGLDHIVFILFLEYCSKNNRILVLYVKILSPVGTNIGIFMKNEVYGFCPELRFVIGIPSLILIFYAWYIPESPRWSLSYCRKKEAWSLLTYLGSHTHSLQFLPRLKLKKSKVLVENLKNIFTIRKFLKTAVLSTYMLFFLLSVEYSKREYIHLKDSLKPYAHHSLLTMAKLFSFMYVLPPVIILRRRLAVHWFFFLSFIQIGISLFTKLKAYYVFNILMMMTIYSVRNLFSLYICEIFPTCFRATAFGTIRGIAFLLYLVHFLIERDLCDWSLHTYNIMLCVYAFVGMLLVPFLPEVKYNELPDYKRYRRDYQEN